jgi:ferredoxin-nitrite reductase
MNYQKIPAIKESLTSYKNAVESVLKEEVAFPDIKKVTSSMGVYGQRDKGTYMQRVRIPGGICEVAWLKSIYKIGKDKHAPRVHFTTRQDIQYHGLTLKETVEVQHELLENGLAVTGGGGNQPRNAACSPLSGIIPDATFDVAPYALAVCDYIMATIDTFHLPRKYKIAFSNDSEDTVNACITDLGFRAVLKDGQPAFKVYVGGGMGRNPKAGIVYDHNLPVEDILYVVEGVKRFFEKYGNYENRNKARLRYIVMEQGEETFLENLKAIVQQVKLEKDLTYAPVQKAVVKPGIIKDFTDKRVLPQKQKGLYAVYVHPQGGYLTMSQLGELVDLLERIPEASLRLTMNESFYICNLNGEEAESVKNATAAIHVGGIADKVVACVGSTTCQIGIAPSEDILTAIHTHFKKLPVSLQDALPVVHISGCTSSCTCHQVQPIGFFGGKKRIGEEVKTVLNLSINGQRSENGCVLGEEIGAVIAEEVPQFLENVAKWCIAHGQGLSENEKITQAVIANATYIHV